MERNGIAMRARYATSDAAVTDRKAYWRDAIDRTYFPLDLSFTNAADFSAELDAWSLGPVSLSRNASDSMVYRRRERHLLNEWDESFLITIPQTSEISFNQDGKTVICRPGAFLVERSHLPYEFSHRETSILWVLKVPSKVLRARVGRPERLATLQFDATRGVGALFVDMIQLAAPRLDEMNETARDLTGKHLVDLLALAVEADERVLGGQSPSVRAAHLQRAERFIRSRLHDTALSPQLVAADCGVSTRYLHQLFETEGTTVCSFIRRQRILMCDEMLRDPSCRKSISEIAYRWGFADQAQFSRHYRAQFGKTPSEAREPASAAPRARPRPKAA